MWKFVTRGIRESLERRASCRTNVYSQTSDGGAKSEVNADLARSQKFLAPVTNCNNGFFGKAKSDGPKDKRHDWDARRSWSDAVGWSSVLAVGWVVCQSLCLRRRLFERSKEDKWHNRLLRFQGVVVPPSFIDVFSVHRQHVLPVTNCVASRPSERDDQRSQRGQQWTEPRPYGPITIEEALKEAKDNYTKTHRLVMGEFELRFGVKALEEKRYKDALKHFSTGASLSSSGSMFNLGLCHELGIGTVTNPKKAAKYYREAADRGHPDAMYNLGVFHAQGRGGLTLDVSKARELFTEAANLGQIQARVALELEKTSAIFGTNDSTSEREEKNFGSAGKIHEKRGKKSLLQMTGFRDSVNEDSRERSNNENSYYDASLKSDPTESFLQSLGVQTRNPVPILVGPGDSSATYFN